MRDGRSYPAADRELSTVSTIPHYVPGRWTIDPVHSDVSFTVRHMVIGKVRGRFGRFSGAITTAPDPARSTVRAEIDLSSVDTNNEIRDNHLRTADFLDVANHPTMTYQSTGIRATGTELVVDGELTLKGITRAVPLLLELNGFGPNASGGTFGAFSARTEINRRDFGVRYAAVMEGGGAVVGDAVTITLEIEANLEPL